MRTKRSREDPGILEEAVESSPLVRCVVNCFFAELYYFPYFLASSFPERVSVERHFNSLLNLDRARDEGLIANYSIQWERITTEAYPKVPLRVKFYLPGGTDLWNTLPRPLVREITRIRRQGLSFPAYLQ